MEKTIYVSQYRFTGCPDDDAILACLRERKKYESATIVFDGEDYWISRAVCLPSNTTVIIDGCAIRQKDKTFDNVFRGANVIPDPTDPYGMPLQCAPIENIRILGKNGAAIIGPEENAVGYNYKMDEYQLKVGDFWGWRTIQISLSRCSGFEIGGIAFRRSRCWTMSFDMCQNGHVHDISLDTRVKNGDGVNFRSGCRHCTVENVTGFTLDDTVACTALFAPGSNRKNRLYPMEPSWCIQERTEEERNISHITVRNIHSGGRHHGIICLASVGNKVHHIHIENISEAPMNTSEPWRDSTVRLYTGYGSGYNAGDLHDITVENVHGVYANNALYCNAQAENVTLKNITHETNDPIRLDYPEGITVL